MRTLDCRGMKCPKPVIETKKLMQEDNSTEALIVLVDNEIAVENLTRLADDKGWRNRSEKLAKDYRVILEQADTLADQGVVSDKKSNGIAQFPKQMAGGAASGSGRKNTLKYDEIEASGNLLKEKSAYIVQIASDRMGDGAEELGEKLMQSFFYALTEQDVLPETVLFYNAGVKLVTKDSSIQQDLAVLRERGVEILACGLCLDYYKLTDKISNTTVTNMYVLLEKMRQAEHIVKP